MMCELKVDYCNYKAAKYATTHWHYSKSMPTPPVVKIGVWECGKFIGVVLFSRGANCNLGKKYGLKNTEVCELSRIALSPHKHSVTKIVSIALKMLKRRNNLRLVYSYADRNQGHSGKIYQAGNWIYTGETPKSYKFLTRRGIVLHPRQVSSSGFKLQYGELRKVPKISDCSKISQLGKHRYLYPLDRNMRKIISKLAKPYPV